MLATRRRHVFDWSAVLYIRTSEHKEMIFMIEDVELRQAFIRFYSWLIISLTCLILSGVKAVLDFLVGWVDDLPTWGQIREQLLFICFGWTVGEHIQPGRLHCQNCFA